MKRPIKQVEDLKETIENLERQGCMVMAPDNLEKDFAELDKIRKEQKEKQRIQREKIKKESFKRLDPWDYDLDEMLDSIVPACCKHECMVEPDGYCEHGQTSILLYHGLI